MSTLCQRAINRPSCALYNPALKSKQEIFHLSYYDVVFDFWLITIMIVINCDVVAKVKQHILLMLHSELTICRQWCTSEKFVHKSVVKKSVQFGAQSEPMQVDHTLEIQVSRALTFCCGQFHLKSQQNLRLTKD